MKLAIPLILGAAILFGAGSPGIRPRAAANDYPARETAAGAAIGASIVPSGEVKKIFAADLNGAGYIVIEVGVFPSTGGEVDLSPADFTLLVDANKIAERPVDSDAIAASMEKKQPSYRAPRSDDVYLSTGVSIGRESYPDPVTGRRTSGTVTGTNAGVGIGGPAVPPCRTVNCDDQPYPYPAPPPVSSSNRGQIEQELWQKSLPDGKTQKPVAGYLYFPKPSGKAKNAAWVLRWDNNADRRVNLTLQSPAGR